MIDYKAKVWICVNKKCKHEEDDRKVCPKCGGLMIRNNKVTDMLLDIKNMSDKIIEADKFIFTDEKKVYKYCCF